MERSPKRPRLSVFEDNLSDIELDNARYHNDLTLKSRFESIFEKYAQDFTGIGDEIDILSGTVVVNNGHLESMTTETDPGLDNLPGGFTSAGRSMLRAMTVTLNPDLPGPDDVLTSIETIAENAALIEISSDDDSDDDNIASSRPSLEATTRSTTIDEHGDIPDESLEPYNSDSDSLFEENRVRSTSIDSLFADPLADELYDSGSTHQKSVRLSTSLPSNDVDKEDEHKHENAVMEDNGEAEILAKFGTYMGKEVLNLIGQRREAHIEPAWRIPVQLKLKPTRQSIPRVSVSSSTDSMSSSRQRTSLWKAPNPTNKRTAGGERSHESREESIDPLQEDMSDAEEPQESGKAYDTDPPEPGVETEDVNQEMMTRIASTGECPYCHVSFGGKSSVMAHWDRSLNANAKRPKPGDPHDYNVIGPMRSSTAFRVRDPRLVVYDFRTMVELHEGAGMSFDDIASSKTLRTHKNGLQLQEMYNRHRTPPECKDPTIRLKVWTEAEKRVLQDMCKNPLVTMTTLRRRLKKRSDLEIGNYLAGDWIAQLRAANPEAQIPDQESRHVHVEVPISMVASQGPPTGTVQSELPEIKQEDSGDELFGSE